DRADERRPACRSVRHALPRAPEARAGGLRHVGMGRLREQPQGALLSADQGRAPAARTGSAPVGADHRHPCRLSGSCRLMRRLRGWFVRLFAPIDRVRSDRDIDAELRSHLELHIDDNIRAGMSPDDARRQAWIALGGVERTKDVYRDQRGFPMLDSLSRDVRHAVRLLLKTPAFAVTAIAILGLGIGANAAIFSVVNAVVLRPLPYPESSRIVRLWHTPPREQFSGMPTFPISPANYLDWRAQSTAFERLAAYGSRAANLTGRGEPDALTAAAVSRDFFEALRVNAIVGRVLAPGDDEVDRSHVVVLSEPVWKTRFGG